VTGGRAVARPSAGGCGDDDDARPPRLKSSPDRGDPRPPHDLLAFAASDGLGRPVHCHQPDARPRSTAPGPQSSSLLARRPASTPTEGRGRRVCRRGRLGGPSVGRDRALQRPPCRPPQRLARPAGLRVLRGLLYVLGPVACQAPLSSVASVASSASIAASSAWVWIRPSAINWPPDRRTAEPNGPAQVFS